PYRRRIPKGILLDDCGSNFFLIAGEKIQPAFDGAQHRDDPFRIVLDLLLARNNYHEWKSRHDAADVEERRKAFLFEFHSFQKGNRRRLVLARSKTRGSRGTVADTVEIFVIAVAPQALLRQAFDRGEFRHAAWPRDADDFAFEIVDTADPLGAEQSVV